MKLLLITVSLLSVFILNVPSTFRLESSGIRSMQDSLTTITISVVGDLMCHGPQFQYAMVSKDSFNFNPVYRNVKSYLEASDLTFGNLETVTAGKENGGYTGYPYFNSPAAYLDGLKYSGFDLLTTANNHSLDRGEKGVIKTLDEITSRGFNSLGTYKSQQDRDSIRIFDIKGIKVSVLAYTYGLNGNPVPKGKDYLINLIDLKLVENDILTARKNGADIVLVHYHFGEEYFREPAQYQKDVVNKTIQLGADIIIGGHPHVIQPVEFFKTINAKLDSGFVAYSMGNFISNQRERYKYSGMILTLQLTKNNFDDKIELSGIEYLPTWVYKGRTKKGNEYVILPSTGFNDSTIVLSKNELNQMNQSFEDTRYIVTKYTNNKKLMERKE